MGFTKLCLVGCGVGLLFFSVPRYFAVKSDSSVLAQMASWEEVQATVKTYKVITQTQNSRWYFLTYPPKGAEIIADYTYQYKGAAYTSSRVWPCPPVDCDVFSLERYLKSAADMWAGRTTCFVNPASPGESVLSRKINQSRLHGQAKIFGFGIVFGLIFCGVPLLFWAKNRLIGPEVTDVAGYWAKPSQMVALNEHVKPIAFLFFAAFICFHLFTLPGGVQAKDMGSWIRLVLSLLLFMAASIYALKRFLPFIGGRRFRLKLHAPSYKVGEPIRMTLCIGVPLPEGGEAHVTLRCQRRPQGEETESGKMFIKLFELKKCVSCPVWPEQGGDLQLPLEFIISELDIALWNQDAMSHKDVIWGVLIKLNTPQASYERGFVLPMHA